MQRSAFTRWFLTWLLVWFLAVLILFCVSLGFRAVGATGTGTYRYELLGLVPSVFDKTPQRVSAMLRASLIRARELYVRGVGIVCPAGDL